MVVLQSLALAALFVRYGRSFIKKHAPACYIVSALIALATVWGLWSGAIGALPGWCIRYVTPMFTRGALSMALFAFVMFAGAVPNGSAFMKHVMPIRGELSIIASILAVGHGAALVRAQLLHLLQGAPMTLSLAVSLVLIAVMLPLFVTSFKRVRRKMQPKNWKRLQRCAYGFYALAFLHILLFNLPSAKNGSVGARINVVVYGALFLAYAALRVGKALAKRDGAVKWPAVVASVAWIGLLAWAFAPDASLSFASANALAALQSEVTAMSAEADALHEEIKALREEIAVMRATGVPAEEPAAEAPSEEPAAEVPAEASPAWPDGSYTGAGVGYNGRLTVSVRVEEGRIAAVTLTGTVDDEEYVDDAQPLLQKIVDRQSADIDAVSGATSTSEGILEAVKDALSKAIAE